MLEGGAWEMNGPSTPSLGPQGNALMGDLVSWLVEQGKPLEEVAG